MTFLDHTPRERKGIRDNRTMARLKGIDEAPDPIDDTLTDLINHQSRRMRGMPF